MKKLWLIVGPHNALIGEDLGDSLLILQDLYSGGPIPGGKKEPWVSFSLKDLEGTIIKRLLTKEEEVLWRLTEEIPSQ